MKRISARCLAVWIVLFTPLSVLSQVKLQPGSMRATGVVDSRYLSFNVEAVEVTGGRFWKPHHDNAGTAESANSQSSQRVDPYQYRPPIDLSSPKLRMLASALAPAYVRVSGTWRNSTYFQDDDAAPLTVAPDGFKNVLTRSQWKAVIDFSHAVDAEIVTSVSISGGTRDSNDVWTPNQAKALFDYTKREGGQIRAVEFMNEPTFAKQGNAPDGYDAAEFARDVKIFKAFLRSASPDTLLLGPGSIGEGVPLIDGMPMPKMISSEDMLKATGPIFDAFSYHFYTTLSERCVGKAGLSWAKVLTPAYLDRNLAAERFYASLRDAYSPGKAIWLTETGEAGCGGDWWASSFIDCFRFMDQLGSLAQKGVKTVIVNTLASSDYGLLDEDKLEPRSDYWGALLWKRIMGARVLEPGVHLPPSLRLYAHCLATVKGGVGLLALNLDEKSDQTLYLPNAATRFTLSAPDLLSKIVILNGTILQLAPDGTIPKITGQVVANGNVRLAPQTITFIAIPEASNESCKSQ